MTQLSKAVEIGKSRGLSEEAIVSDKLNIVARWESKITVSQALGQGVQVSGLRNSNHRAYAEIMYYLIMDLVDWFKAKRTLDNKSQINTVISLISAQFWHLKIEEIAYVFNNAKSGAYGNIYERLTGDVILGWLRDFDASETKSEYFETHNRELKKLADNRMEDAGRAYVDKKTGKFDREKFYAKGLEYQRRQAEKEAVKKQKEAEERSVRRDFAIKQLQEKRTARFKALLDNYVGKDSEAVAKCRQVALKLGEQALQEPFKHGLTMPQVQKYFNLKQKAFTNGD